MGETTIDARDTGKIENLSTGKKNTFKVKTGLQYNIIEMEDINFHFDSAVLLPDYGPDAPKPGTPEQNRITGLGVLYACYKYSEKNEYKQKILVAGHTDKKGSAQYNLELSKLRAKNVYAALTGDKVKWTDICVKKHKTEDYQQILKWISYNWGWDCDPGKITDSENDQTKQAVHNFQKIYNKEYKASISEDGKVGKETWNAFFDIYTDELTIIMGIDRDGLMNYQSKLQFVQKDVPSPAPCVGCGENFPASKSKTESENSADRRVELLFFDDDDLPELKCHPKEDVCSFKKCDIYNTKLYKRKPVTVDPVPLPSGMVARVFLQLKYSDPEKNILSFPEDLPITIVFPDGTKQSETIGKNGKMKFEVDRKKKSFTLNFSTDNPVYIGHPSKNSPDGSIDKFIFEPEVKSKAAEKFNVFKLPLNWSLLNSDWTVKNTSDYNKPDFKGIEEKKKNIGSEASPVELELNPHWLHLKFTYFDRWLKTRLGIPQLMLEGFQNVQAVSGSPDVRSNWLTEKENCLCVPWILQLPPKPDNKVLIQFRSMSNTFIESTGTSANNSRRYVTKKQIIDPSFSDAGLNAGDFLDKDFNKADSRRLAYYDIPVIWKSKSYFAKLSGGKNNPPSKTGKFEDIVPEKTEDDKPLMFSLDDMVLTDKDLNPINWKPDNTPSNRYSIFCNTFSRTGPDSASLSSEGLYKPDGISYINDTVRNTFTSNNLGCFTQLPTLDTGRNYLAEYPDTPRLVIAQGNFFDVFNKRTPDQAGQVVGARAAVRLIDVFGSSSTAVPPGTTRPRVKSPIKFEGFFSEVQPLFEQQHVAYSQIGRFDIIRLRCCDVDSDGVTELSVCMVFIRFFFNFNASFKPAFNPHAVPANFTGANAASWSEAAMYNLLHRWNGPDSISGASPVTLNPGNGYIVPLDSTKEKFKSKIIWFAQQVPLNLAHFEMGVFTDTPTPGGVRAYMVSSNGTGPLDTSNNVSTADGWFTFAHESGHGGSLVDEYVEPTVTSQLPGAWLPGFDCNSPGSPFEIDDQAIMRSNRQVRARHYWHLAEWYRQLEDKKSDYKIKHGIYEYSIPHHSDEPYKNYVGWPIEQKKDEKLGERGKFDIYFNPLGKEKYTAEVLPGLTTNPALFDGIIVVLVKMKFNFKTNNFADIHNFLNNIHARILSKFNFKFGVKGTIGGRTYNQCLLYFSPRYLANNYSATSPRDSSEHFKIEVKSAGKAEWDSGIFAGKNKLIFAINIPHVFNEYFANMIGLEKDKLSTAANYSPIAQKVIQNATVFKL